MNKKPRFFCDNCGTEVDKDVKSCPYCGRFFASVRCPSCGYSGPDRMFQGGCPMCGYSTQPADAKKLKPQRNISFNYRSSGSAPAWTYVIPVLILLALIALISHFITK